MQTKKTMNKFQQIQIIDNNLFKNQQKLYFFEDYDPEKEKLPE